MRVLLVHNHYRSESPSGEDRVVEQEAAALAADGHHVERFERFSDDIARRSLAGKALVPVQVVWSNEAHRSLTRVLQSFRPDVVHLHNTFPLVSASALHACRAQRVPAVATVHNYRLVCPGGTLFRDGAVCLDCVGRVPLPSLRHRCYRDSAITTLPVAAALVAQRRAWWTMLSAYVFLSSAQRDVFLRQGLPRERVFVKPNFVPSSPGRRVQKEPVVVFAGRFAIEKGIDLLMEAWDRFLERGNQRRLSLVIAGGGPMEATVTAWAAARPSVNCVGLLSRSDCAELVARARAVIVPSRTQETFGLTTVEAMAAAVPSLAPAHGSFPEIIRDGVDGVLYQPGDPGSLADALEELEREPGRLEALGRAAQTTYTTRFTPEANLSQLLAVYRFAIDHPVFAGS